MEKFPMRDWYRIAAVTCLVFLINGCHSQSESEVSDREAEAISNISSRDKLRLTLADASGAGIYLFDLKLIRDEIMALKKTEPALAEALLSDLDRVEALPKTDHEARAVIGREMYDRIRIPQ